MLFTEIVAVYCENHTEHAMHSVSGMQSFSVFKTGDTYSNHYVS
jgi:hypothetical protein